MYMKITNINRSFIYVVITAILFKLAFVLITSFYPIIYAGKHPASIFHVAPGSDYGHYLVTSILYFHYGPMEVVNLILKYHYGYEYEVSKAVRLIISPDHLEMSAPTYPALIWYLDYRAGHTLPMAILYIVISIGIVIAWLKWLHDNGMPPIWLLGFSLLPHPMWFMINCGSDLLFFAVFTIFFLCYFSNLDDKRRIYLSYITMILSVLVRPTGVSILLFLIIIPLLNLGQIKGDQKRKTLVFLAVIGLPIVWFFWPYLESVVSSAASWPFFGVVQTDYLSGIYDSLPLFLDVPLSWLSLFGAKTLYICGLRPSYSDVSLVVFLARLGPGIPFLAGLLYLMWNGPKLQKILVIAMLLPLYIGPGQDRYLLPIQPILFYHAWRLIRDSLDFWRRRKSAEYASP